MIEIIHPEASAKEVKVGLFDFDGTLSLIRSGWVNIMVPMMVEILLDLKTGETKEELTAICTDFVAKLTGRETIYQMMEFAEQIKKRGGQPSEPLVYKHMYLDRLMVLIGERRESLRSGEAKPEQYLMPGARALLEGLKARGMKLYVFSGTDEVFVREEVGLVGLTEFFDGGIFGAHDDIAKFSKAMLIEKIISSTGMTGKEIMSFGDGFVEIEEAKKVGGVAVGVASDEPLCQKMDEWKRARLTSAGADWLVPNFANRDELFAAMFGA